MKNLVICLCFITSIAHSSIYNSNCAKDFKSICINQVHILNLNASLNNEVAIGKIIKNPCNLVKAIMFYESSYNPQAFNDELSGSYGLMQIQCDTAKLLNYHGQCSDLFNPKLNIFLSIQLLKHLETRYNTEKDIIAAYNAGRVIKLNDVYVNNAYVLNVYSRYKGHNGITSIGQSK